MDRCLKCPPRHQFSIHNDGFRYSRYSWIFWFFQNFPNFLLFLDKKIHLTPIWNLTKFVRNFDFGSKTILQPFRVTNEDHFSYRDYNFWTKIRSCGNRFSTTMDFRFFTVFIRNSFTGPYRALCEAKFHPYRFKKVFFGSRFFRPEGLGVRTNITNRSG